MKIKTSDQVIKLTQALLKAEKEIKHAIKDASNAHLRNSYATLESVIDASKEELLKNEVIVIQAPVEGTLITRLQHTSGEYIEIETPLLISKQDMQGLGSAITYARRYSLASLLNISQSDDDGNLASGKKAAPKVITKKPAASSDNKDF